MKYRQYFGMSYNQFVEMENAYPEVVYSDLEMMDIEAEADMEQQKRLKTMASK